MRKFIIIINIAYILFLLNSLTNFFVSIAVIPENYQNDIYTNSEVKKLAAVEKRSGYNLSRSIFDPVLLMVIISGLTVTVVNIIALNRISVSPVNKSDVA